MKLQEVITALKGYGTEQNIKIYRRHGVKNDLFGVSFGNLGILKKKIKTDHELSRELWATNNMDAMTLATMIADPDSFTSKELDVMVKDIDYYLLSDLFGALVAKTKFAKSKFEKWSTSKKEFVKQTAYVILCPIIKDDAELFTDAEYKKILQTIQKEIHGSPNRARHSMYMALICIGIYRPKLTDITKKTAEKIGKVEVDHGETSCKTPDAIPYIEKALNRKK